MLTSSSCNSASARCEENGIQRIAVQMTDPPLFFQFGPCIDAMSATIAIFDLDGTITRRDTYTAFLLDVLIRNRRRVLNCIALPGVVLKFKLGRVTNDEIKCAFLSAVMGGFTRAEVEHFTAEFLTRRFAGMTKPKATARIDWHRQQGHQLMLATASLDFYALEIGRVLGFDHVIATQAAWHNQRIAGYLEGSNLRGEEKLAATSRALRTLDVTPSRVIAYSDDHSDLPLLRFADHGIAIDPTPKLAVAARHYGLRIEHWCEEPSPGGGVDLGPDLDS